MDLKDEEDGVEQPTLFDFVADENAADAIEQADDALAVLAVSDLDAYPDELIDESDQFADEEESTPDGEPQGMLFDAEEIDWWRKHWRGMPEFVQEDQAPWQSVYVHFESRAHRDAFAELVGQRITDHGRRTRSIWFPKAEIGKMADKRFVDDPTAAEPQRPRFPLYIVSKGRHEHMYTSRHLAAMGVPHHIVVEEQEREAYEAAAPDIATVLVLDSALQDEYETCDDLGFWEGKGCSGPARNFAWEHSLSQHGADRHWVMDDNIDGFYRLYRNIKTPCLAAGFWRAMESFVLRYENVSMAGPNYFMFASRKTVMPPVTLNTRIYSCNLIRNDLPYRWRGRYNEDTDLSLRMLKDGWSTVLFNALLQLKLTTQTVPGGNTDSIYAAGTLEKSEMLVRLHPDVATVAERWGRDHHYVDYSPFKRNRLRYRADADADLNGPDEHGMVLQDLVNDEWVTRDKLTPNEGRV